MLKTSRAPYMWILTNALAADAAARHVWPLAMIRP